MTAIVILDILSGMPNPQWDLAPDIAKQICDYILQSTHSIKSHAREIPGLGYRGFLVQLPECPGAHSWLRIYSEVIENGNTFFKDENRYFERLLLSTAENSVEKALFEHTQNEIYR